MSDEKREAALAKAARSLMDTLGLFGLDSIAIDFLRAWGQRERDEAERKAIELFLELVPEDFTCVMRDCLYGGGSLLMEDVQEELHRRRAEESSDE